jgi:hypothetical protein
MSDLRSLPDTILRLYLGAYGVWGVVLAFLFALDAPGLALTLTFPLALFLGLLTLFWARGLIRRHRSGELTRVEVDAAVRSVGHILAAGSLTPAIVFLAEAPLQPSTWATVASVGTLGAVSYGLVSLAARRQNLIGNTAALTLAWAALPLNATGAVSVWAWVGNAWL